MSPRTVSREILMEKLWDDQTFIDENTLNVNVARLRKKLQEIGVEEALETVRGYGYRLNVSWRNEWWKIFLLEHNPFILLYFINMFFLFIYRKLGLIWDSGKYLLLYIYKQFPFVIRQSHQEPAASYQRLLPPWQLPRAPATCHQSGKNHYFYSPALHNTPQSLLPWR